MFYICDMKQYKYILFLLCLVPCFCVAQNRRDVFKPKQTEPVEVPCVIVGNDTFPCYKLPTVYVYPPMKFKNKKEEKFYWRTVRDVKVVLPLSKYIRQIVRETNDTLMQLSTKKERDRYMKGFEKELYSREEARFKKLTYNQGKLLIRMVDREFDLTSYEIGRASCRERVLRLV